MNEKSIYCYIVYAFLVDGGESVAQADRIFPILRGTRYTDHTVYPEHGAACYHRRRTPSDRIPVVLLLSAPEVRDPRSVRIPKRMDIAKKKKLNESASFLHLSFTSQ